MKINDQMKKEDWINHVLDSANDIQKTEPTDRLYKQIIDGMNNYKPVKRIQRKMLLQAAAAIIILVSVNLISIVHYKKSNQSETTVTNDVFTDTYFSYITNN